MVSIAGHTYGPILALLLLLIPGLIQAQEKLAREIDALIDVDDLENAFWGIHVVNLRTNDVVYARNARKSFMPASNMKLYTTSAALDQLGDDFRYRTQVYVSGTVQDSILEGSLIVKGSGDPSIGGRFSEGDLTLTFRTWADSLLRAGIRHIRGDIIGDDDCFDDEPFGVGWSWDDLPYWYAAELGGLVFNDNCVDIEIKGTQPGQPAEVAWYPSQTDYVQFTNATLTISPDSSIDEGYARAQGSHHIRLSSHVPAGKTDKESLTVPNPTLYFTHVLRQTLIRAGITIEGRAVDIDDLSFKPDYDAGTLHRIATHSSPPLSEIVQVINKKSHNLYADQLLKTLALEVMGDSLEAGTHEAGIEAAMFTFAAAQIDTSRIRMIDGSGLSYMNMVTPEMTTRLLRYMWRHPNVKVKDAFVASLPIGGVDGSLEYRFRRGPARRNVRAKTGFITGARTLSGYVDTRSGDTLAFSVMCNHYTIPTREINELQDELINLLAGLRDK